MTVTFLDKSPPMEAKDIPDYPGYRIDKIGNLFSCRVGGKGNLLPRWSRRKPVQNSRGYWGCYLGRGKMNKKYLGIHVMVMLAHGPPKPPGMMVRHYDGNPSNNHIDNLRWGTVADNMLDAIRHGTTTRGARNWHSKLTEEQVIQIRKEADAGANQHALAKRYNVKAPSINVIYKRKSWRYLPG